MAEKHFQIEQLDQERLVKVNDIQQVSNPTMFNATGGLTADGLLSNEIFGITKETRANIPAYINLEEYFIQPYFYKIWLKIDKNLKAVIYETKNFRIDSKGYLVEDENGGTGIKFLKNNIDKIKFKDTKKDAMLKVLMTNKSVMFTKKIIIIPPYYRDVNNNNGRMGVGEINKLYTNLINNVRALRESNDYGLTMSGGIRGKIQDSILQIYNWFTIGEAVAGGEHTGSGIFKKFGITKRSVMSKTTDYSARLVLSAPSINVDSLDELMVDMDYCSVPLSAVCVIFYPYMLFNLRQMFNNIFGGKTYYDYTDKNGKLQRVELLNPQIEFSDDRFEKEINKFIHGYSNRLEIINIPNVEGKRLGLEFKGYNISKDDYENGLRETGAPIKRHLTWCDMLYIAACECVKDKMVLITRYPIDSYFNQFSCKANVASTVDTEPMVVNGEFYRWYPKIREEDIGSNTSNKFIDTCSIANPFCPLMGADYDGDQITISGVFSVEANKELLEHSKANSQFITLSGTNGRVASGEAIQAMYNLTLVLPDTKLTDPKF
jgi:hypothetical protein